MSTASRGRALEHEIVNALKAVGFATVRGAGSKGQIDRPCEHCGKPMKIDFLATKNTDKTTKEAWLVVGQCKLGRVTHGSRSRRRTAVGSTDRQDPQPITPGAVLES